VRIGAGADCGKVTIRQASVVGTFGCGLYFETALANNFVNEEKQLSLGVNSKKPFPIRMTNYIETRISMIPDRDFKILISELCKCVGLAEDQFEDRSLANLLTAIVTERRKLDRHQIPIEQILAKKVKKLASDSVVYGVCCELLSRKGKSMDDFAGKPVFMLFKQCYKVVCPPLQRTKPPTRREINHRRQTELINRRRSNGSYF
jgi:hypothetical protein